MRVPRWVVVTAALALAVVVVGVNVYGYLARPGWVGVSGKTFWDYLELLIVPAVIGGGVAWFNRQQQRQQDELEAARAQADAFQAYLDQMGTLLLQKKLHTGDEAKDARNLARARTLTMLDMLSPERKPRALEFLFEMGLIQTIPPDREPIISSGSQSCARLPWQTATS